MIHYRHLEATKNDSKLRDFLKFFIIFHLLKGKFKVIFKVMRSQVR